VKMIRGIEVQVDLLSARRLSSVPVHEQMRIPNGARTVNAISRIASKNNARPPESPIGRGAVRLRQCRMPLGQLWGFSRKRPESAYDIPFENPHRRKHTALPAASVL